MAVVFLLIGTGFYAISTRQTARDLCHNTGYGIVAFAQAIDAPVIGISDVSHAIGSFGGAIEGVCS